MDSGAAKLQKCLVIGGSGFLGLHIVHQLMGTKRYRVTIFDVQQRMQSPELNVIIGDIRNKNQVENAVCGMDVIIHCATAMLSAANSRNKLVMEEVNVLGTQNVIDACKKFKVPKLIYTSSASVVYQGKAIINGNETLPYAHRTLDYYTQTKIQGEKLILEANSNSLATVALRPSFIWGDGDPMQLPSIIQRAKAGKLKYYIGSGENVVDYTYVGNIAHAHVLAADKIQLGGKLAGQPYFITDNLPTKFWRMTGDFCEALGYQRPQQPLPVWVVMLIATIVDLIIMPLCAVLGIKFTFDLTRFRVAVITTDRTFNINRATTDLGYEPMISREKAFEKTIASFSHLRKKEDRKPKLGEKLKDK